MKLRLLPLILGSLIAPALVAEEPLSLSGIYPSLAMYNLENECGTGAVVPWAGSLWVVTYAPHKPLGSTDKLYQITPDLQQIERPESVGGTPANRMIHRESQQLFISYYAIDKDGNVRVIPPEEMPGRPTGTARHLTDPENKVYTATMEEGFYEVDVNTLEVVELYPDGNMPAPEGREKVDILPGYHGKGLYSGQGVLVYANNGEHNRAAWGDPTHVSGVLAEWDGKDWEIIRRNQFTEVTGRGGIYGAVDPANDPIWSIGWDYRSLILMMRQDGAWHSYRLPKGSHSYDGAHGWNTEWPRIREIGDDQPNLLMTMHGTFWWFPEDFSLGNAQGIRPRSNYLKVIGDFARWGDRIVLGTDDTAKNEFLNTRRAKGKIAAPQSQSNLWFVEPDLLDELGPAIGRGGVWVRDDVPAGAPSDPFLIAGYDRGVLHLAHQSDEEVTVRMELDRKGTGQWEAAGEIVVGPKGYKWIELPRNAEWMRLIPESDLTGATAWFHFSNRDERSTSNDAIFDGIAKAGERWITGGIVRALDGDRRKMSLAAMRAGPDQYPVDVGYYELDGELNLNRVDEANALASAKEDAAIPVGVLSVDEASVVFVDQYDKRWRLPMSDAAFDKDGPLGASRTAREVATERDLFNAHGTFYELPARNAGGFAKVRPVATHNLRIHDFCSYRGLFIMSGMSNDLPEDNPHVIRSQDGQAAVWAGAIDDVWRMGKPRGHGGPWKNSQVQAGVPSDPYLMTAYDVKTLTLSHDQDEVARITVQVDLTGEGTWVTYRTFEVKPGEELVHEFPAEYSAYWLRTVADRDMKATAWLVYE